MQLETLLEFISKDPFSERLFLEGFLVPADLLQFITLNYNLTLYWHEQIYYD